MSAKFQAAPSLVTLDFSDFPKCVFPWEASSFPPRSTLWSLSLLGILVSIPWAGPVYFNQRQEEGSSLVVIRMIGCEMTTGLFSFLQDSSLVFRVVSSLEDVTEKCKIAPFQHHQPLLIRSAQDMRAGAR